MKDVRLKPPAELIEAMTERAKIVAWLDRLGQAASEDPDLAEDRAAQFVDILRTLAEGIAAGDHNDTPVVIRWRGPVLH